MNKAKFKEVVLDKIRLSFGRQWITAITQDGLPSIIGCVEGYFVSIELQWDKGEVPEPLKYNLQTIIKAGGLAVVVNLNLLSSATRVADSLCNVIAEFLNSKKGGNGRK